MVPWLDHSCLGLCFLVCVLILENTGTGYLNSWRSGIGQVSTSRMTCLTDWASHALCRRTNGSWRRGEWYAAGAGGLILAIGAYQVQEPDQWWDAMRCSIEIVCAFAYSECTSNISMLLVRHKLYIYITPLISVLYLYTLFQFLLGLFEFASVHNTVYMNWLDIGSIGFDYSEFGSDPCSLMFAVRFAYFCKPLYLFNSISEGRKSHGRYGLALAVSPVKCHCFRRPARLKRAPSKASARFSKE